MSDAQSVKKYLGIREWLYYESSRVPHGMENIGYYPIIRRMDAVTGELQRQSFDGSWHTSRMEYAREYAEHIYGN